MSTSSELVAALTALVRADKPTDAIRMLSELRKELGDEADTFQPLLRAVLARCCEVDHLRSLAGTDPLTRIPNRRTFEDALGREVARHNRSLEGMAVLLLDLDGLKELNDVHGHAAGDEAIVALARVAMATLRSSDLLARLGGDEFAVLLPEADRETAELVATRVRAAIEGETVRGIPLRVSVGLAVAGERICTAERLLENADERLYADKSVRRSRHSGLYAA
ncbi:MAG: GGDEF domain-containing protein [Myxococcota bacterium]